MRGTNHKNRSCEQSPSYYIKPKELVCPKRLSARSDRSYYNNYYYSVFIHMKILNPQDYHPKLMFNKAQPRLRTWREIDAAWPELNPAQPFLAQLVNQCWTLPWYIQPFSENTEDLIIFFVRCGVNTNNTANFSNYSAFDAKGCVLKASHYSLYYSILLIHQFSFYI